MGAMHKTANVLRSHLKCIDQLHQDLFSFESDNDKYYFFFSKHWKQLIDEKAEKEKHKLLKKKGSKSRVQK